MRRFSAETGTQAFSRGSRDEGIFPRQQRRRFCNDPLTIDLFCHGVQVRGFSALGLISANFLLTERKICAMIYQLIKYATVAQSVEQLIRNQQVAGSSPASSSSVGDPSARLRKSSRSKSGCFFFGCAPGLLLLPMQPAPLGLHGVPFCPGFI